MRITSKCHTKARLTMLLTGDVTLPAIVWSTWQLDAFGHGPQLVRYLNLSESNLKSVRKNRRGVDEM